MSALSNFEPLQTGVTTGLALTSEVRTQARAHLQEQERRARDEILQRYQNGETAKALAREFGLHHRTVAAMIEASGLPLRRRQKLSQSDVARICELYASGLTTAEIASQFGCYDSKIRRQLIRLGIKLRTPGRRKRS